MSVYITYLPMDTSYFKSHVVDLTFHLIPETGYLLNISICLNI